MTAGFRFGLHGPPVLSRAGPELYAGQGHVIIQRLNMVEPTVRAILMRYKAVMKEAVQVIDDILVIAKLLKFPK